MARTTLYNDGPMLKTTVSVPQLVYQRIAKIGGGNFSGGIRIVQQTSMADPDSAGVYERVVQIGAGDFHRGLGVLLTSYEQAPQVAPS